MTKNIISTGLFVIIILTGLNLLAQTGSGGMVVDPVLRTEMIYEYSWDAAKGEWVLKNTVKYDYTYGNEETQEITTSDYVTGIPKNRVIYQYAAGKILREALYQDYIDGTWVDNRRDTWIQNSDGLNIETIIQYFLGGHWKNISRYTDYQYEGRRLKQYTFQSWNGTDWADSFYDSWYYNENGQLVLRTQIRLNGTPVNQFIYDIGIHNLRERMTINNWINDGWAGFTRRNYEYNRCGTTSAVDYQDFKNGEWINTMRQEYVYSMQPLEHMRRQKVAVCHRGHTIYVPITAVEAHLSHGDCLGKCLVEERGPFAESTSGEVNRLAHPFTVFPVPAIESITVRINLDSLQRFERIELADYNGNVVRTIRINDEYEIVIPRNNLAPGFYYIRVAGDESFSQVIVFK